MMEAAGRTTTATTPSRKVMVVADPTRESEVALQYTLLHVILGNDTLILLHVNNPNAWKNPFNALFNKPLISSPTGGSSAAKGGGGGGGGGAVEMDFLEAMKHACEVQQPKIKVVIERVEMNGKDRPSVIHAHSVARGVDVLVIGQRNRFANAILGSRRSGSLRGLDTAEYLIENCECTCVGVQKKGQNAGYVLNTKTHKNFWLLA